MGVPWTADTSVSDPLQSATFDFGPLVAPGLEGPFVFELGFSTLEQPGLGALFDSLTVTLGKPGDVPSGVVATLDVFGLTIPNPQPGGLFSDGAISFTQVTPGGPLLDAPAFRTAYRIDVLIPPQLQGGTVRATFDFFNNGDGVASRGYVNLLSVPEPASVVLGVGGTLFLMASTARRCVRRRDWH